MHGFGKALSALRQGKQPCGLHQLPHRPSADGQAGKQADAAVLQQGFQLSGKQPMASRFGRVPKAKASIISPPCHALPLPSA